jgi:hypothetical protein
VAEGRWKITNKRGERRSGRWWREKERERELSIFSSIFAFHLLVSALEHTVPSKPVLSIPLGSR